MKYISCKICGLQYKDSDEFNHELLNSYLAAGREYYEQKYKF